MSGSSRFLGPFKIVDELEEKPRKKPKEDSIVEEPKVQKTPKSETLKNNSTQPNPQKKEPSCEKQSQDKTCEKSNNSANSKDTNPKSCETKLTKNNCINSQEEANKASVEVVNKDDSTRVQEVEKSVKEGKPDSTSLSHEDQTSAKSCQDDHEESDKDEEDQEEPRSSHPYTFMIETFELTKDQKSQTKISPPKSLKETPVRMINSRIGLLKLLPALNSANEIALNVYMDNYQFETTIQLLAISTRDTDYIIDVEKVNREILLLTEIFINPKIVKIIYNPKTILTALQNVLHLYLVNIFDCERAAKTLLSGYLNIEIILLKEYSYKFDPEMKQVDCRLRPVSSQFQDYCRSVPHYLIYMYHDFKNKLLSKDENLYKELMNEFRETSKIVYPSFMETKLLSMEEELQKHHKCQLEVLEKLNDWRNDTAIKLRKIPTTIITKPELITLSSILPVTEFSVCCISKSPFVKDAVKKILEIIKEAKRKYSLERLPITSKRKIAELKEFLLKELDIYTSNLNNDQKMNDEFENPKDQKTINSNSGLQTNNKFEEPNDQKTSNSNAGLQTNNSFEKPKDQKIGEVARTFSPSSRSRRRRRPNKNQRMAQRLLQQAQSEQIANKTTGNDNSSSGVSYFKPPVYYSPQKSATSTSTISNNSAIGRSSGTSISYNALEVQKRVIALKRKLSINHQRTDEEHNDSRKKRT